jgi:hypothetical protein
MPKRRSLRRSPSVFGRTKSLADPITQASFDQVKPIEGGRLYRLQAASGNVRHGRKAIPQPRFVCEDHRVLNEMGSKSITTSYGSA